MKRTYLHFLVLFSLCSITISCNRQKETLFTLLSAKHTGISFNNEIRENDTFNILTHEYIYNGGGVGIADFNNDGLQDIFFTGNVVPNKLYLNQGDMKFTDVSEDAGITIPGRWNSGVAIADINNDGWMDIYVCATMHPDSALRRNMLFINQGSNEKGVPKFTDQAHTYGLQHGGYSVAAAFFDYDKDDDLDLYLLINQRLENIPTNYRPKITDGSAPNNDRLFRNNSDGTFTDVTIEAGITIEGFGLGVSISDLNLDGWPDVYVSNDYLSNDILYVNNGNGTFSNRIAEFIAHQSQFSMGNDAADINNDGMPDLITLDMLPETNYRKKTTIGNKSYLNYINNEKYHYEYQYVRNMLHVNNGLHAGIKFSEVGQLSGVQQTEWSWSPLFADFDNDGHKDLVITNGFPKDITDKDFANYRAMVGNVASLGLLEDSIPVVRIPNYIFKNNADLTFKDMTKEWGFEHPSFSNGAAFADLDNDGDLDYVINNINSEASVFQNNLYDADDGNRKEKNNYLRLVLADQKNKKTAVGAKVKLYCNASLQFSENNIYRGFLSSVEHVLHFGLGNATNVDSVVIQWPDGNVQKLTSPGINQLLTVHYQPSPVRRLTSMSAKRDARLFEEAGAASEIAFRHNEEDKIDFNVQRTLPHKFTQSGPGLAAGDVNGDGMEDFVAGGSTGQDYAVFFQQRDGTFRVRGGSPKPDKLQEDESLLLFDADQDRDLDLYIVSGSIEHYQTQEPYQDRLYVNDGKGNFTLNNSALPDTKASGSCVRAADFDRDGDLDLFVGGRVVPAKYPESPESYLLRNDDGAFTNVTDQLCPALKKAGMVTDAIWTDYNGDNQVDLMVVGEFTPIMFFQNRGNGFAKATSEIDTLTGWWNSITAADFDRDGDMDYVVGNLGLNNAYQVSGGHPLKVYAKDFDGNGSMDAVMACYMRVSMESAEKKLYPIHFWDELNAQSPKFRNKFSRYRQYANTTMDNLLDENDLQDALVLEANEMASVFVENLGKNQFGIRRLPSLAQVAPVNGMVTEDINGDGFADVLMIGNDYGNEVFAGRYDAFNGLVLLGDGKGNFTATGAAETGFYVPGDAKSLVRVEGLKGGLYIASQNRDSLKVFRRTRLTTGRFVPESDDVKALFVFADGATQLLEFYHGSGYLSQSTRVTSIPAGVSEIMVYNSKGESRKIAVSPTYSH